MTIGCHYAALMSTLPDSYPDPDPEQIRVRLRAHMGVHKISRARLAIASGISRSSLALKLDGPVEFTVPEINAMAHALNKSWLWVMTGQDGGTHGDGDGLPRPDRGTPVLTTLPTNGFEAIALVSPFRRFADAA